jgi:hypothetical protein
LFVHTGFRLYLLAACKLSLILVCRLQVVSHRCMAIVHLLAACP